MKKYAIRARKLLTNGREHGIIIFVLARLAQLVEHMLDVHGVTGSSPVPRTIFKNLGISRVPRLFVVLPKNAVGIIWKTLKKVAKISFSRVCMPDKKNRRSPLIIWGGRLLLYPRLLLCSACEIIHAYAVQVCKAHQCLYIRFILADFIARQSDHIDARPLGCFLLGQPALFSGFL